MTIEIERRTLLQMLAAGLAGGPVLASSPFAFAQNADAVTIGWPSRRAVLGSQPALHARMRSRSSSWCSTSRSTRTRSSI